MQEPIDRVGRHDAVARRRRMQRRLTQRRVGRVLVTLALVYVAAVVVRPEGVRTPATVSPTPSASGAALVGQTLMVPPLAWQPAGAVLRREVGRTGSPLPFMAAQDTAARETLSRWHRIYGYSRSYRIRPELARRIYDAAITAGIEPELGFRLVKVESEFRTTAISPVGAIGLTQLMLGTARHFEPRVTRERLLDPDVNLRIGFRYLRGLIREYKGDLRLALLVYNRGPVAVQSALAMGVSPANGYESVMLRGYRGRGTLD